MFTTNIHNVESIIVETVRNTSDPKEGWISFKISTKDKWSGGTSSADFTLFCNDLDATLSQLEQDLTVTPTSTENY